MSDLPLQFDAPAWPASVASGDAGAADATRWQESLRRFYGRVRHGVRDRWLDYYYVRIKQRLADIIPPDSRVLDVGCGTGDLLSSLRPAVGVGVDLNEAMVEEAQRCHPHLRFLPMRGEDVRQLNEQFDYVVLSQPWARFTTYWRCSARSNPSVTRGPVWSSSTTVACGSRPCD